MKQPQRDSSSGLHCLNPQRWTQRRLSPQILPGFSEGLPSSDIYHPRKGKGWNTKIDGLYNNRCVCLYPSGHFQVPAGQFFGAADSDKNNRCLIFSGTSSSYFTHRGSFSFHLLVNQKWLPFNDPCINSSVWWFHQPIWRICSSNWIISPGFGGEKTKNNWSFTT